jgi:hypothetical protein
MKKRNTFIENIRAAQEAARTEPAAKNPSEMTPDELEAEIRRLEREIRETEEEAAHLGREEVARRSRPASFGTIFKRNRPYWK